MTYDQNALTWTSAQLLSDVRRKASLPTTSTDFSDPVLLREATDVLWSFAGWAVSQSGDGRLLTSLDRPITAALTGPYRSGSEVALPALAIADTVEHVTWIEDTGQVQSRLARLDPAQESDYDRVDSAGSPSAYALIGGRIRLYPKPTTGGTLRITYQRRHPELTLDVTSSGSPLVGTVQAAVASGTNTSVTVTAGTAAVIAPLLVGDEIDLLSAQQPYRVIAAGLSVVTAAVGAVLVVSGAFADYVNQSLVGARLVRAGQSPYVMVPLEFRSCVTEKVAANVLRIIGDLQGMAASEQAALTELARVTQMLSPRSKRDKPRAVNPYSHMRLRMARGHW